ncbi:MAG: FecR family protein [Flavobacteriaceae bacterium]
MEKKTKNNTEEFYLAQWLEGNLLDTDLSKLVSNEDVIAYKKLKNGLEVLSKLEQPVAPSFEKIQAKIQHNSSASKVRTLNYKWLASIAAMLLFFFGLYQYLGTDAVLNSADFGEQKTVALLDNSKVILNAKSAIKYSKKDWKNNRAVYLSGEAFFKVQKGSRFTVKTKRGDVTVLGTQFTVNATDDFFEVICFEGKVRVTDTNKEYILNPTQAYRKINGDDFENLNYNKKEPTWITGESTYKSVPLHYVISDLEKQYNIKIDAAKIDRKAVFTGVFTHKDKAIALQTVFGAMRLKYKNTTRNSIMLE